MRLNAMICAFDADAITLPLVYVLLMADTPFRAAAAVADIAIFLPLPCCRALRRCRCHFADIYLRCCFADTLV